MNLDMERQLHQSTDIDLRPHLANLAEDLGLPNIDLENIEIAIDTIESAIQVQ